MPHPLTRPAALAAEAAWRTQAEAAPRFAPAANTTHRLTLMQEALEHAVITTATLAAQRVDVIAVRAERDGLPMIEVAAADGERAYGDQATTLSAYRPTIRGLLVTGCLVHWTTPQNAQQVAA